MALRNFADQPPGHRQLTFPLVDHQELAQPNHDDQDDDQSYSYRRGRTTGVGNETDPGLAALLEDRYETIQHTLVCLGIGCYLNLAVTLAALL